MQMDNIAHLNALQKIEHFFRFDLANTKYFNIILKALPMLVYINNTTLVGCHETIIFNFALCYISPPHAVFFIYTCGNALTTMPDTKY